MVVNKKFRRVLGGDYIGADAEVLFKVRIVLRKSGVTDSSFAHHWITVPWPESDGLDGDL